METIAGERRPEDGVGKEASFRDIGLECLSAIGTHYRTAIDLEHLRHELDLGSTPAGTTDLVRAARLAGLRARLFETSDHSKLFAAPRPLIADTKGGFCIVLSVEDGAVRILNPRLQKLQIVPVDEFLAEWTGAFILVSRRSQGVAERFGLSWFLNAMKKFKRELALVLIASVFVQILALATPLLFQIVVDKVLVHNSMSTLIAVVVGMVAVNSFQALIEFLRTYLLSHTASRIDVELGAGVFNHLLKLPVSYFETRAAGQTVARVRELDQIRQFLTGQALTAGLDFLFASILVAILYAYSTVLALVVTLSIPIYVAIAAVLQPILMRRTEERFNKGAYSQQLLVESVLGIQTVKTSAAEPQVRADWEERLADFIHTSFGGIKIAAIGQNLIQWVVRSVQVVVLFLGAYQVMHGQLTVGALIAFNMIMGQITTPVLRLSQLWQDFQQVRVSAERLSDILNHPQEPKNSSLGALPAAVGSIQFSDVTFRYRPDRAPVLEALQFSVPAGQSIGIIGPSGSGKSTLSKLVQRLYLPERGQVMIDGLDISQVDPTWLRRQVGVVLQENFLFNRSIHDNIALSNPAMSRAQVIHAARLAGAHEFIGQMPQGYDTQIEERGANLSGGQRQRIAIARALATNPKILIFDEATSALDYESEEAIQNNMREIAKGRTVIVIAHRLAAVTKCDRIITLDRGRIVEDGPPRALVENHDGFFARMLKHQNQQVFV
ncbi:type I secretion system permease/ATPase [Rhizobium sp. NXC14]|uniref:peptidase domain-containing ABC transporter n=1 Tax=Rhizobium sp. NXC14 TaxID=1981173 RepID=UPI001FD8A06E|nr:type I secretion system permease/ATPase [Rhizobium sp. NXC14]